MNIIKLCLVGLLFLSLFYTIYEQNTDQAKLCKSLGGMYGIFTGECIIQKISTTKIPLNLPKDHSEPLQ